MQRELFFPYAGEFQISSKGCHLIAESLCSKGHRNASQVFLEIAYESQFEMTEIIQGILSSSIDGSQKSLIVEEFISKFLFDIRSYAQQVESQGPHSFLGKFYREQISKRETYLLILIDEVETSRYYDDTLLTLIWKYIGGHPQLLPSDVITSLLQTDTESNFLLDKLFTGAEKLFPRFKVNPERYFMELPREAV